MFGKIIGSEASSFIDLLQKQNKPHEHGQMITKQLDEVVVERKVAMTGVYNGFKMRREKVEPVKFEPKKSKAKIAEEKREAGEKFKENVKNKIL